MAIESNTLRCKTQSMPQASLSSLRYVSTAVSDPIVPDQALPFVRDAITIIYDFYLGTKPVVSDITGLSAAFSIRRTPWSNYQNARCTSMVSRRTCETDSAFEPAISIGITGGMCGRCMVQTPQFPGRGRGGIATNASASQDVKLRTQVPSLLQAVVHSGEAIKLSRANLCSG